MKKLLIFLMLFISIHSMAEWTYITRSSDNELTISIDKSSIRQIKNKVRFWTLNDYVEIQKKDNNISYLSSTSFQEIDCIERTGDIIEVTYFNRSEAKGKIVDRVDFSNIPGPRNIRPDSLIDEIRKFVCKK